MIRDRVKFSKPKVVWSLSSLLALGLVFVSLVVLHKAAPHHKAALPHQAAADPAL